MKLKLLSAVMAAALSCAPAEAQTFVQFTFSGFGPGVEYDYFSPTPVNSVHYRYFGSALVNIDAPAHFLSDGASIGFAFTDHSLSLSHRYPGPRSTINNSVGFIFSPGSLAGLSSGQISGRLIGGGIIFDDGGHFYGRNGTGTPWSVRAELVPGATNEYFELTAAIAAVPEPTTWAMMLVGFGTVGVAMRRRKQTRQVAITA